MRRAPLVPAAILLLLAACSDEPTEPPSTTPSAAIVHGPSGGNPFFQWLPFLFNPPSDFSADLSPRVEICALGSGGSCPLIPNGTFTRTAGHGSTIEVITDNPAKRSDDKITPRYELIWRTQQFALREEQIYRVRVLVGARELGFVDLRAARNFGQALRYTRESQRDNDPANDVIGFRMGDPFPLLWGIFKGALCHPLCTPQNAGTADVFEGTVPADGGTFYTPSGHAATKIPALPNGQEVNLVIARVAGACLPTHMQTAGGCYLFDTEPQLPPDLADVLVATCLNQSQTDGHWALFKFNPDRPDLGVRQLEHADEELIEDCSGFALRHERGAARYALAGLRLLMRPLAAVFGPKPVSAAFENRGFTHTASGMEDGPFSVFDWAKPVRIVKTLGDGQTGAVNTTLFTAPTVQVLTGHGTAIPVTGARLDFTFTDPAGAFSSSVSATTDANGNASALWPLGNASGTYTLTVALAKFTGVRQSVTYDAVQTSSRDESDDDGSEPVTPQVTFTAHANPFRMAAVGSGFDFSCGLRSDGAAFCWGQNNRGQLGNGSTASSAVPVRVSTSMTFERLFVGDEIACGLDGVGRAHCWGGNGAGQLGAGIAAGTISAVPVPIAAPLFTELDLGLRASCGMATDGLAYCWGGNNSGELGVGLPAGQGSTVPLPVTNSLALGLTTVNNGFTTTCGIGTGNQVFCWGRDLGGFGNGVANVAGSPTPVPAASGMQFAVLELGSQYACALNAQGRAHCWGRNFVGELGNGSTIFALAPTPVFGELTLTSIDPDDTNLTFKETCALTGVGDAWCWGYNEFGQLGAASTETCVFGSLNLACSTRPVAVTGGIRFSQTAVGAYHSCGLSIDGVVYCWGRNHLGQLGDGTLVDRPVPNPVRF